MKIEEKDVTAIQFRTNAAVTVGHFTRLAKCLNNVNHVGVWRVGTFKGKIAVINTEGGMLVSFSVFKPAPQSFPANVDHRVMHVQSGSMFLDARDDLELDLSNPSNPCTRPKHVVIEPGQEALGVFAASRSIDMCAVSAMGRCMVTAGFCTHFAAVLNRNPRTPSITCIAQQDISTEMIDDFVEEYSVCMVGSQWKRQRSSLRIVIQGKDDRQFEFKRAPPSNSSSDPFVDAGSINESGARFHSNDRIQIACVGFEWSVKELEMMSNLCKEVLGCTAQALHDPPYGFERLELRDPHAHAAPRTLQSQKEVPVKRDAYSDAEDVVGAFDRILKEFRKRVRAAREKATAAASNPDEDSSSNDEESDESSDKDFEGPPPTRARFDRKAPIHVPTPAALDGKRPRGRPRGSKNKA